MPETQFHIDESSGSVTNAVPGLCSYNQLRVLMLLPGLPRAGPVISVYDLTKHLLALGVRVEILAMEVGNTNSMAQEFRDLQVPVHEFAFNKYNYIRAIYRLWRFLRTREYDVVQSTQVRPDVFLGLLRATGALDSKRPFLLATVRSRPAEEARISFGPLVGGALTRVWARAWARFDVIVPIGQTIRGSLLETGVRSGQMVVISNGVDISMFRPPTTDQRHACRAALGLAADDIVIGSTSRLVRLKGLHLILQAMSIIGPTSRLKFLMVGGGPESEALEKLSIQLGLNGSVLRVGENRDVRQFLHAMDLFVLPSFTEGLPSGLLEAGACGLPVIVSDIPACRDLVTSGETGCLFEVGNVAALAEAVQRFAGDSELRASLGRSFRGSIEREFSASEMARRYANLYRLMLTRNASKCATNDGTLSPRPGASAGKLASAVEPDPSGNGFA